MTHTLPQTHWIEKKESSSSANLKLHHIPWLRHFIEIIYFLNNFKNINKTISNISDRIPAKLKGTFGKHMLLPALIITNFHSCSRWVEGSVKFSSVPRLFPPLWSPMDCSTPSFLVHHQLPELAQTHIHRVSDAIQPSHPLSSASPPTFILAQHQGLFHWVSSSQQVAKVVQFQLQHQSFQWIFRTDFL